MAFWIFALCGLPIATGVVSAAFLFGLHVSSAFFRHEPLWILALPSLALLTVYLQKRYALATSTAVLVREAESPRRLYHPLGLPFVVVFSCLSQLFGASTGREGTAVQIGAAIAEYFPSDRRRYLRHLGMAAGFGGVFGLPWAGALFAWECHPSARRFRELPSFAVAAWVSHLVSDGLWPHSPPGSLFMSTDLFEIQAIIAWAGLGLAIAVVARLYLAAHRELAARMATLPWWAPPLIGSGVVIGLSFMLRTTLYNGLGTELIQAVLSGEARPGDLWAKMAFTLFSLAAGLWGGEVTPILSMGAVTGALVSKLAGGFSSDLAGLGMVALFAACAAIPFTGVVMTFEIFGAGAVIPAVAVIFVAHALTGGRRMFNSH